MKNILKIFALTAFLFSNNVLADNAIDESKQAAEYINDINTKIISIASNKAASDVKRKDQLIAFIDGIVDSNWIAKFVLAKHYRSATDAQKEQFKNLYRQFLINTYAPKFNSFGDQKFEVKGATNQDKYYVVKCVFYPKDSANVLVDFRIRKNPDAAGFTVLDIVIEGVSLIETQRSEFGAAIAASGLDKFLVDLDGRVKKLKSAPAISKAK